MRPRRALELCLMFSTPAVFGCGSESAPPVARPDAGDVEPPPFGAADWTMACPAGQVGWDFGTGHGRVDVDGGAPATGKVCIPWFCPGGQVRDKDMKCVTPGDGGLPVVQLPPRALSEGTPFVIDTPTAAYQSAQLFAQSRGVNLVARTDRVDYHGTTALVGTGHSSPLPLTPFVFCPAGQYANGYRMRAQAIQSGIDNTGLNAVELSCAGPSGATSTVRAHDGEWGEWTAFSTCPAGSYLERATLQVLSPRGSGDDSSASRVQFTCSGQGGELAIPAGPSDVGNWTPWAGCLEGKVVCGIAVRFMSSAYAAAHDGDNEALHDLRLACCDRPGVVNQDPQGEVPLFADVPYQYQAGIKPSGAPFKARVAIWATRPLVIADNPSKLPMEAFVCTLANLDLTWDGKSAEAVARTRSVGEVLAGDCLRNSQLDRLRENAANHQWLLWAFGLSPDAPPSDLGAYSAGSLILHASFDPMGDVNVPASTSSSFVLNPTGYAPNPPGFFYIPHLNFVDWIAYYWQREIWLPHADSADPAVSPPAGWQWLSTVRQRYFDAPATILAGIYDFEVRTPSLLLNPFEAAAPTITFDTNWFQMGDVAANPYSSQKQAITTPNVTKLANRQRKLTLEVRPAGSTEAWWPLGAQELAPEIVGVATGSVMSGTAIPAPRNLDRLYATDGSAWGTATSFDARVCFDVNGIDPRIDLGRAGTGVNSVLPRIASGRYSFTAGVDTKLGCVVKPAALTIQREFVVRPLDKQRTSLPAMATSTTSGGSDISGEQNAMGSTTCEDVTLNGQLVHQCVQSRRSDSSGAGFAGQPLYTSQSTAINNESATHTTGSGRTQGSVLGYNIIDTGDSSTAYTWGRAEGPKPIPTIIIKPNFSALVKPSEISSLSARSAYGAVAITSRTTGKLGGLGVGWQWKTTVNIGPIPGEITFTVGAALAIGLELAAQVAPDAGDEYPCLGDSSTKCFSVAGSGSQADAQSACNELGGRLAEIAGQRDLDGITQAATQDSYYWIGGQTAYTYPRADCKQPIPAALHNTCTASSHTSFRWIGSDREFARMNGVAGTVDMLGNLGIPARPPGGVQLESAVPTPAGVVYHGRFQRLTTLPQGRRLPFVCEFDGARRESYFKTSATLNLEATAGVNLSFYQPSPDLGVGLEGTVDFVSVGLALTGGYYQHTLYDDMGKSIGTRGAAFFDIPWNITLLHAVVEAKIVASFFEVSWPLLEFPGYTVAEGKLFSHQWPTRVGASNDVVSPPLPEPPAGSLAQVIEASSHGVSHTTGAAGPDGTWISGGGTGDLLRGSPPRPVQGPGVAVFRMQLKGGLATAGPVARIEVRNKTSDTFLATRLLDNTSFGSLDATGASGVVDIRLPFDAGTTAVPIAVRVVWTGQGTLTVQRVVIESLRSDYRGTITVGEGSSGTWKGAQLCPEGSFVNGYRMRVEADQGTGDDTALNGIELSCVSFSAAPTTISYPGLWGDWDGWQLCAAGVSVTPVTGGQLKIQADQGSGDDTAASSLKLRCWGGSDIEAPGGGLAGDWGQMVECPGGQAVCGMEVRFQDAQGNGADDTALNGVRLLCCGGPA